MKSKGVGRSYFQQLAQPVLPGTTVLTARPVSASYANETAPQVPIIEDRFNFPDNDLMPLARESARTPINPIRSEIESPTHAADPGENAHSSVSESRRTVTHHLNSPRPSSERARAVQSLQHLEAQSDSATSVRVHSAQEGRSVEQPRRAETPKNPADSTKQARARIAHSLQKKVPPLEKEAAQEIAAHPSRESVQESMSYSNASKNIPSSQSGPQGNSTKHKEIQQAAEVVAPIPAQTDAKQKTEKPGVRSTEGPRVHIGTVEIRAVLPQPVVPQPVAMTQNVAQNNAVAQARGRSGVAEPLARGLDWSYGLVQG